MRRFAFFGLLVVSFLAAHGVRPLSSFGQEATTVKQPAKVAEEKEDDKEPVKRLPAHYKDVVTEDQKTKIYALQEDFNAKISVLAEQIKKLQADRAAAIEALLTAEQKKKIEDLKAAAKAKAASKTTKEGTARTAPEVQVEPAKVEVKPAPAAVQPKPPTITPSVPKPATTPAVPKK